MAATAVNNLQQGLTFGQQLSFDDFLVDLNQFYANKDYVYEQNQGLTYGDYWESENIVENKNVEPIHEDFGLKSAQEEYKNMKIDPNIYEQEEDWRKKDAREGNDILYDAQQPVNHLPDIESTKEEKENWTRESNSATKNIVESKEVNLKKWDYKPFLTSVINSSANMLGMDNTSVEKEHGVTAKQRYTTTNKYESTYQGDSEGTKDRIVNSVNDNIFYNWERPPNISKTQNVPPPTKAPALLTEHLKVLELKKIGSKFSSKVQRIRKRKKASVSQNSRKKKQKDVTTKIKEGELKKRSLYKWFKNLKNSGRFHL